MIICGLDSALRKSGGAILDDGVLVHAEAFTARGEGQGECFASFRRWWRPFLKEHGVEYVAIEEPLRSNGMATSMKTLLGLYGQRAQAIEICATLEIPVVEVNVQDWRQAVHGVRTAPRGCPDSSGWWKAKALSRCAREGWDIKSTDAAEAALIGWWLHYHHLNPPTSDIFASAT